MFATAGIQRGIMSLIVFLQRLQQVMRTPRSTMPNESVQELDELN